MEPSAAAEKRRVRLLGLGNELLADDAFGLLAAERAAAMYPELEVVSSSEAGLALLDHITGVSRLIIVDTLQTGKFAPGTLRLLESAELKAPPGGALHGAGLREVLALARQLGLGAPEEVYIIAVEPADCWTIGGHMHPDVEAALPPALRLIGALAAGPTPSGGATQTEHSPPAPSLAEAPH